MIIIPSAQLCMYRRFEVFPIRPNPPTGAKATEMVKNANSRTTAIIKAVINGYFMKSISGFTR